MRACMLLLLAAALFVAGATDAGAGPAPGAAASAHDDTLATLPSQTLDFAPAMEDHPDGAGPARDSTLVDEEEWLSAPIGERLLTEPEAWRPSRGRPVRLDLIMDYNRVDPLRLGVSMQAQDPTTMAARIGARLEYATGRDRLLYGALIEQPLLPRARVALGVSMSRRTDHGELQQVDDLENSLALLLGRQDYRDYFEREGFGAYVAWRVPDFSVVSVHARNDTYRSLAMRPSTASILQRDRVLRDNPPVDEGDIHSLSLRLERQARRTAHTRAGFYHWIDVERAGGGLGGEFAYTRALADMRSVLRLSPASTLVLRAVGGHTATGTLPAQKLFTVGGVDGLRAHSFGQYRGDQMLLAQAEYTAAVRPVHATCFDGGLHAIAFVDAGRAWADPSHAWDPARQHLQADGGFGLSSGDDNLRVYVARSLQRPRSGAVFSARLRRPF